MVARIRSHADALIVGLLALMPLLWAWALRHALTYDDAYITLTYARNLALGRGFVYNGGEPYLGTTTPLLALLLGGLGQLLGTTDMYTLALGLGTLAWAGSIWLAFRVGRAAVGPLAGVFAAAGLAFLRVPHFLPSEYPLLLFLSLAALLASMRHRLAMAGILFGLAFLTRGDAALLAGLVGLVVWRRDRRLPWAMLLGFVLILTPWFLYAFKTFGSPLPATLGVKRAHRALGAWPHIALGAWRWLSTSPWAFQWQVGAILLGALTSVVVFARERRVWALVLPLWGGLYALAYGVLNVPFYGWYAVIPLATWTMSTGMVAAVLWASARSKQGYRVWAVALMVSLVVAGGIAIPQKIRKIQAGPNAKIAAYLQAAVWLHDHTPPDASIGFIEVGTIAYFSDRHIVDLLGLVTPGTESYLIAHDNAGLFKSLHPDYYIRNCHFDAWGMNRRVHESPFFQEAYGPVAAFPQDDRPPVVIYRRQDVPGPPIVPSLDASCQP